MLAKHRIPSDLCDFSLLLSSDNIRSCAVIYYGMDEKYSGCNIVESVVTSVPSPRPSEERTTQRLKGKGTHFLIRLIVSALVIGVILVLHFYPTLPFASGVTDVLRKVFCYDVFGRGTFGTVLFGL